jgi:hypothetical protein
MVFHQSASSVGRLPVDHGRDRFLRFPTHAHAAHGRDHDLGRLVFLVRSGDSGERQEGQGGRRGDARPDPSRVHGTWSPSPRCGREHGRSAQGQFPRCAGRFQAIAAGAHPWVRPQGHTKGRGRPSRIVRGGHRGASGGRAGARRASSRVPDPGLADPFREGGGRRHRPEAATPPGPAGWPAGTARGDTAIGVVGAGVSDIAVGEPAPSGEGVPRLQRS